MDKFEWNADGLPINDAVPAPTRIMPGNEFLWNWRAMQEYARTAIKAVNADADAAEEVLALAAAEQVIRAEGYECDAERYRWLREHLVNWCPDDDTARLSWSAREVLDAEIDAAMNGANA